jgi:iron complex outermembrane recepter protein
MRAPAYLLLLAAAAGPLRAQADTTRRDTAYLAPTVVTVTRTTIDLARAPYAISVNTRDQNQRGRPGLALDETLAGIPGLQVDNRFNYAQGERISIRGFGARAQFGVRGVRLILDGIPMTLADGQTSLNNIDVAQVARAEVVRGPASAMHGNAAGGVIQLSTDSASELASGRFGGNLRQDLGEHGLARSQLSLAGVGGPTSVKAAHSTLDWAGYRQWNQSRNDRADLRVTRDTDRRNLALVVNWMDFSAKSPGGLDTARIRADRNQAFTNNLRFQTGEWGRQTQVGATWRERLSRLEIDVSAHGLTRGLENPIPQRIVVIDRGAGGARLALSTSAGTARIPLRLSAGTEVQLQHDDRRNYVNLDGVRGADTLDQLERVTNTAAFAQVHADLMRRAGAMLGLRVDRIRFEADDRLIGPGNPDDSGERTMSAVSPSFGLSVHAGSLLDVYSNVSTSFETPTTSELANQESGAGGINTTLEPQRTRSVEVGINGRLRWPVLAGSWQLAAYSARVSDALIPFEVATLPGRQYYRNAGSTKHRGIETGASLVLPADFSLRAAYTYTEARFDRYSVTTGATTAVYDGNRVPGVAPNRADATLSWLCGRYFADWDTRIYSSIPVNDANSASSPAYTTHGIRLGVRDVRAGAVSLASHVGVMNVFDVDYNSSVVVNAFGGRFFEPGPPRSFYGGVAVRF